MKNKLKVISVGLTLAKNSFLPKDEIVAIMNDKDLTDEVSIIMNAPIKHKDKLRVLYDPQLRTEAVIILESLLSIKTKKHAFKNPDLWDKILTLADCGASAEDIDIILYHKELQDFYEEIIITDPQILESRAAVGLSTTKDVISHVVNYDPSGKTIGCGCEICKINHQLYIEQKYLKTYEKEAAQLDNIDSLFNRSPKKTKKIDPFNVEFFDFYNPIFVKGLVKTEKKENCPFDSTKQYKKRILKLEGNNGKKIVLARTTRVRNNIHNLIVTRRGKEATLQTAQDNLKKLIILNV